MTEATERNVYTIPVKWSQERGEKRKLVFTVEVVSIWGVDRTMMTVTAVLTGCEKPHMDFDVTDAHRMQAINDAFMKAWGY